MTKKTYLMMAALVLVLSQVGSTGMPAYADTSARASSEMPIHTTERASLAGLPLANITAVEAGSEHTCALTASGGVKCWGYNYHGQLGDGTTTNRLLPVNVSGLTSGITALAAGGYHTCALTAGSGAKCWGSNWFGQLGDGTTANRLMPVDVSGLTSGVAALAAGENHTCALTVDGGVKCWGLNNIGQLGDGTNTSRSLPVDVSGLTSGVTVSAIGQYHTCALTGGGGVKCWGDNEYGRLGDGTTTNRFTPVDVSGLAGGAIALAAGWKHTCAVTAGGGVKCWGNNEFGQLGDGTTTNRFMPADVSGLTSGVAALAAGRSHTCAVMAGGGVKCWGYNYHGQLGDGTNTYRLTPVDVVESIGVELSPGYSQDAAPGSVVTYTHVLTNTGTTTDTFTLDATSSQGWPVSLPGLPLQLNAGLTTTFLISLSVPSAAIHGTVDTAVITATSQTSPTISAVAMDTTTVKNVAWYVYLPLVLKRWPPIPDVPVLNPISNPDGDGNYTVSWNAAYLASTYTLQEDDDALFPSPTTQYTGPGTSWPASGKPAGTYYYRVKATNGWGDSGWSNVQSVSVLPPGIFGRVTVNGVAAGGVSLDLRFYNGSNWSTYATTTTGSDGKFLFAGVPGLAPGQVYYVLYRNGSGTPGRLWIWGTRELTSYTAGNRVDIGQFDIADIALVAPANSAMVALPYAFRWTLRPATPSDTYEFNLFDPSDLDPYFYTAPPLGYVGSYTLNSLPPGFSPGTWYLWNMWVYSPDGGVGISYEDRWVAFSNTGMGILETSEPFSEKPSRVFEDVRDR